MQDCRGWLPKNNHERSRARRKRKCARQAGSPDLPPPEAVTALNRLGYYVRTGSKAVRRLYFAAMRTPPVEKSGKVRGPTNRKSLDLYRAPVAFRRGEVLNLSAEDAFASQIHGRDIRIPRRPSGGILRFRSVPFIGYDHRVGGTCLEAPTAALHRRATAKKDDFGYYTYELNEAEKVQILSDPLYSRYYSLDEWGKLWLRDLRIETSLSKFELDAAVSSLQPEPDFMKQVLAQASPEILKMLASESWGVMKF